MAKQTDVLLREKAEFTRFQILFQVLRHQPHVKQKDISDKLGITIQAVSKYFKRLARHGYLEIGSERADYRLTSKGIAKLHENLRSAELYFDLGWLFISSVYTCKKQMYSKTFEESNK